MNAGARATFSLGLACDGACVFCAQDQLEGGAPDAAALPSLLFSLRSTADEVSFVGGEPARSPLLPAALAAAREAGFLRIGLQTNGRELARAGVAAKLRAAGLTDVQLSIHGARPEVHDYHAGAAGSLEAALSALVACRAAGLTVAVLTVITRSSFRVLSELPRLLGSKGASAWLLAVPHAAGAAAAGFDRVIPRLGLALPFALHALELSRQQALPAFLSGAPLCGLGPFASRALPLGTGGELSRAYGVPCQDCAARPACPGVDPVYLARFGGDELARRELPLPPATGEPLARLFVGAGPLQPPATPGIAAKAPGLALPVVGKAEPARAEVAGGAPRRSGEALRELFPGLFREPGGE